MIPEIGSRQEFKRALLSALPDRKILSYRVVNIDRSTERHYQTAAAAILALRKSAIETATVVIIEPVWYSKR